MAKNLKPDKNHDWSCSFHTLEESNHDKTTGFWNRLFSSDTTSKGKYYKKESPSSNEISWANTSTRGQTSTSLKTKGETHQEYSLSFSHDKQIRASSHTQAPFSSEPKSPSPSKPPDKKNIFNHKRKKEQKYQTTTTSCQSLSQRENIQTLQPKATLRDWLYEQSYFIGSQVVRSTSSIRRHILLTWQYFHQDFPTFVGQQKQRFTGLWEDISSASLAPFRDISKKTILMRTSLHKFGENGKPLSLSQRFNIFFLYLRSLGHPMNQIINLLAPIIGITVLAATISFFSDITFGLYLTYPNDSSFMGYIADEKVFYDAQSKVLERMVEEEYLEPNGGPGFRLAIVREENLLDAETLANQLISVSGNEIESADGIYIEDSFLGAIRDGSEFLLYIDSVLDNYRSGEEHELVQFAKKISLRSGIYPTASVKSLREITSYLDSGTPYEEMRTVKEGETIATIAHSQNITIEELRTLNPHLDERLEENPEADVLPGEELLISQTDLSLGIQVTRREEYMEDIPFGDTTVENSQLPAGYTSVISNGIPGRQRVVANVTYIDNKKVDETRLSVEQVKAPVNRRITVGTKPLLHYLPIGSDTSGSFLWPVDGGYISAGLYGYPGHTGLDIAAPAGTIVRACRAGYVTYATNTSIYPYGKRVDLNHMDGFITRYAHMSTVVVQSGTYVEQGQIIGYVGRTGRATGNHLHLEIRLNGRIMNPVGYVGSYYPGR